MVIDNLMQHPETRPPWLTTGRTTLVAKKSVCPYIVISNSHYRGHHENEKASGNSYSLSKSLLEETFLTSSFF